MLRLLPDARCAPVIPSPDRRRRVVAGDLELLDRFASGRRHGMSVGLDKNAGGSSRVGLCPASATASIGSPSSFAGAPARRTSCWPPTQEDRLTRQARRAAAYLERRARRDGGRRRPARPCPGRNSAEIEADRYRSTTSDPSGHAGDGNLTRRVFGEALAKRPGDQGSLPGALDLGGWARRYRAHTARRRAPARPRRRPRRDQEPLRPLIGASVMIFEARPQVASTSHGSFTSPDPTACAPAVQIDRARHSWGGRHRRTCSDLCFRVDARDAIRPTPGKPRRHRLVTGDERSASGERSIGRRAAGGRASAGSLRAEIGRPATAGGRPQPRTNKSLVIRRINGHDNADDRMTSRALTARAATVIASRRRRFGAGTRGTHHPAACRSRRRPSSSQRPPRPSPDGD